MNKQLIVSAFIIVFSFCSVGQNNVWHIGYIMKSHGNYKSAYRMDFTSGTPQISGGDLNLGYFESVSVVSDENGNEQMYTDGMEIYDASHSLMYGAPQQIMGPTGRTVAMATQGALSVTDRKNKDIVHLFTTQSINGIQNGLRYHKIDLSLTGNGTVNNPLGEVVEYDILIDSSSSEMLTSFGSCESDSVWVVGHRIDSYDFIVILIDENGVSVKTQNLPTPTKLGSPISIGGKFGKGSMDFSPDGSKLALTGDWPIGTHIMDFNIQTGQLSNPKELLYLPRTYDYNFISSFNGYSVEFSPDGSKLYGSILSPNQMVQFDLEKDTSYTLPESFNAASLEKGPDGNIYVAKVYVISSNTLGRISNPNNSFLEGPEIASYDPDAITFISQDAGSVSYGLPQDNICYTNTITSAKVIRKVTSEILYPNPAVNYVINTLGKELVFHNALGSVVLKSTETKINVSKLVEGVYFVKNAGNFTRLVVRK
jgi:hypothetical protein